MKAKEYVVLTDCVERGVDFGWNRAYKHTDCPSKQNLIDSIEREVLTAICEYFDFDDTEGEAS